MDAPTLYSGRKQQEKQQKECQKRHGGTVGHHNLEISLAQDEVEVENTLAIVSWLNLGHVLPHFFHMVFWWGLLNPLRRL